MNQDLRNLYGVTRKVVEGTSEVTGEASDCVCEDHQVSLHISVNTARALNELLKGAVS